MPRTQLEKKFVGKTGEELEKLIDKEMESNFDTVYSIIKENLTKLEKYRLSIFEKFHGNPESRKSYGSIKMLPMM